MIENMHAVVLAGGEGTRMKSQLPKVLHKVKGKPMIEYVLEAVNEAGICETGVVVGFKAEAIKNYFKWNKKLSWFYQNKQLGSANALLSADSFLDNDNQLLVLCADTPLIKAKTLKNFVQFHLNNDNDISILTAKLENPFGYGRILKDNKGLVVKIVEEKDASDEERSISEVNSGIYCFRNKNIKSFLKKIKPDNAKNEYYLTDLVELIAKSGRRVESFPVENTIEITGINSRDQLIMVEELINKRSLKNSLGSASSP
ncbi:MAG: sugar phosphate nucleotidyltransferase [bacterium]